MPIHIKTRDAYYKSNHILPFSPQKCRCPQDFKKASYSFYVSKNVTMNDVAVSFILPMRKIIINFIV